MDTVDITAAVWVYNQEKKAADLQQQPVAPLKPTEVRIKVLFVAINSRDVSKTHCNHQVGSFGTEVIGKVVMVGENVGSRKVGETVGVICSEFQHRVNGFATFIQVDASRTAFLPVNLPLAESACLLNSGVVAYHALSLNKRAKNIAIIGEGNLAYLTTQFAKKVFKLEVTLYANDQATAQAFGADHFVLRSVAQLKKHSLNYDQVVVTDNLAFEQSAPCFATAIRGGKICIATGLGHDPAIDLFDIVINQKELIGVGQGTTAQVLEMLHEAAVHGVHSCETKIYDFGQFNEALSAASNCKYANVVLKVQ